ncbi:glycoside hydrolase family 2 protein [Zasmidium cellare ATCC 36951]|uniref:beta-galactosidase n=1 Tax=Zasmidium cellare ATCC 36951 TaxID=1080233 RepID=A0A6A6C9J0_ZASCE|nr:glycoside hydrolase family 2 protein [Zasmidium cellare ATCC 36951]KAF2162116.1 glycoside hydrolase family 2 protein [Zasmidium cellare ATCC 36951]
MGDVATEGKRPDWANLKVLHSNTLEPRSHFYLYNSEADALSRDISKAKAHSLSGKWKFHLSKSPFEAPDGFHATGFDSSKWSDIEVPGMWQMQGFGRGPHYTNVQFPFVVDPPNPPYVENECGSYITHFRVPEHLHDHQLRLRFEGVDSGFHVYINGDEIGYSQVARNPSEFDVTSYLKQGQDNLLAVRVYQFTDGSYIEDQDQWWLSGIFRDVFLLGFPKKSRFEDLSVQTLLDEKYENATLKVSASIYGSAEVRLRLLDASGAEIAKSSQTSSSQEVDDVNFSIPVDNPHKWTAETPYLYKLVLSLGEDQFVSHRVGFRVVELKDGLIKVNGQRVVFKGANRHEHHPLSGRTVPYEFMKADLLLMKTHNLNSLRTCHQPSDPRLYDLADELGLYVMDEADLECHGFETIADAALPPDEQSLPFFERQKLTRTKAAQWTSNNPDWKDAYVDRAKQLVHRDKLHPSVVLWSLGNEAFHVKGGNHTAMRNWIKDYDSSRPIHYEPDLTAEDMDMHSRMYPNVSEIIEFGKDSSKKKPLVLCEYIHAMGTGPGNIKEYVDAFYQYEKLQGGWLWEWANHGLLTKTKDGKPFYGYGGDFGDVPNDYNFVMDGVLNSDHSPRSALIEYKKAVEPVQVVSSSTRSVKIINRLDFETLDYLQCFATVVTEDGSKDLGQVNIPANIQPGTIADIELPSVASDATKETLVDLSFKLKDDTLWAASGHEVALLQIPITLPAKVELAESADKPSLKAKSVGTILSIEGENVQWELDTVRGHLSSWKKSGKAIISQPLEPNFYRALTDNDAPRDGRDWKDRVLHLAKTETRSVELHDHEDQVTIVIHQRFAPPVLSWSINLVTKYKFTSSGAVSINVKGTPQGQNLPKTLPRIGVTFGLPQEFQQIKWFGRGPGESYKDMKLSQRVAKHFVSNVDRLWANPDFPQECSNRTDTRWLKISSPHTQLKAQFVKSPESNDRHLFDFMASHYDVQDIDKAQHPYELEEKKQQDVILRLDADHHGLGTGSCGPKTLEEYALKTEPFEFTILLQ